MEVTGKNHNFKKPSLMSMKIGESEGNNVKENEKVIKGKIKWEEKWRDIEGN